MADYPLNCTWEEVEHSALNPNVFVTMRHINDPDVGEIDLIDMTVSEIYAALQENPNQQFILIDLLKRQCIMTQAPANPNSEAKFSVLDGTTVYIYSIPNGGWTVYSSTVDVSSGSVFPVLITGVTVNPVTYESSESFDDIKTAILDNKVVFARTADGVAWCFGETVDDEISFVVANLNTQTPNFVLYVLDYQDAVTRSVVSMGGGSASDAVLYTPQTLSPSEQEQARSNIGALSSDDNAVVLSMTLTGNTVALNSTAANLLALCASQTKIYFLVNSLAFTPSAVDTTNYTVSLTCTNNGTTYEVTLAQTASTVMSGTLVSYKTDDAVRYGSQTLTTAQQAQARTNIGALGASDIGTVFTLKGGVATVADLPASGNNVGDVYYVEAVSAGYIWITSTSHPNGYWEELGETIDLSAYQEKPTVVTVTGDTPVIALAENNKIYDCTGTDITSITITARDTNAAFSVIFSTPAGTSAPTFTYPTVNMTMPNDFELPVYAHCEINVDSKGYAVAAFWLFD